MEYEPVYFNEKVMGYCVRIKRGKKFLWVSPGNLITPYKALKLTLKFIKGGRHILMEKADNLSKY